MKKMWFFVAVMTACVVLIHASNVAAQQLLPAQGDDTIIQRLSTQCTDIQATLRRIHTNDSLLRVNAGQVYSGISEKLMAKLNARLAVNLIDSTAFVEITSRFEESRSQFATHYNTYESLLSNIMKVDCAKQPAEFYAQLTHLRDARQAVADDVAHMNEALGEYQTEVGALQQRLKEGEK